MAASPPPASLTFKRLESLSSKKSTFGTDHIDDASSFTSMSSSSNATVCRICKEPESLMTPLIICCKCRSRYHMACPNPRIADRKAEYTCGRCLDKAKGKSAAIPSTIVTTQTKVSKGKKESPGLQNTAEHQTVIETQPSMQRQEATTTLDTNSIRLCEIDGCGKVAKPPKKPNTRYLCFMCDLVERNNTARQLPRPAPATAPRPIKKTKLYHVRPDDRPLVTNKRKRSSSRITSSATRSEDSRASAVPKANVNSNRSVLADPPLRAPAHNQSEKQMPEATIIPRATYRQSVGAISNEEPSRSMSLVPGTNSPREFQNTPVTDPPEYERPSYQANDISSNIHKTSLPRDDILAIGEAPELVDTALNANRAQSEVLLDGDFPRPRWQTPRGIQLLASQGISNPKPYPRPDIPYPEMPSQESQLDEVEDEEMLDAVDSDMLALQHSSSLGSLTPQPPSPMSDTSSYHTPSPKIPTAKAVANPANPSVKSVLHDKSEQFSESVVDSNASLEEKRKEFDESILDSFLLKQSQRDPFYEPSPKELSETQIWGAVDPRTVWPKRWNAAQKEEKMKEIKARGGRKANFGKILHPQLVKERLERGWDIHQSREKRDDDETKEMVQKLEELFGVPEGILGNCVPKTVGGRLVMQEREQEPEHRRPGRQKKEVPLGVYPVIGGQ
ncbi:hypothetical protein DL95DRAFT_398959 [Leptodontidium sp. 2 PMI_412]|nr:hypothetical protein DL95DRAFT_398959 [Leptodontidium sp. 2 PMI_412]